MEIVVLIPGWRDEESCFWLFKVPFSKCIVNRVVSFLFSDFSQKHYQITLWQMESISTMKRESVESISWPKLPLEVSQGMVLLVYRLLVVVSNLCQIKHSDGIRWISSSNCKIPFSENSKWNWKQRRKAEISKNTFLLLIDSSPSELMPQCSKHAKKNEVKEYSLSCLKKNQLADDTVEWKAEDLLSWQWEH